MKLLPDEEKLVNSNDDKIILTNHRIQMSDKYWGQSFTISIFLEHISSMEMKYRSSILFLILGIFLILGGVYSGGIGALSLMVGQIILGAILLALWRHTKKHVVYITSDGGSKMIFIVQGMTEDKVADFIHNVSLAKQKRINQLYKI